MAFQFDPDKEGHPLVKNSFDPDAEGFKPVASAKFPARSDDYYQQQLTNISPDYTPRSVGMATAGGLASVLQPELGGLKALSKLPAAAKGIANYLGRIGTGTGITTALDYNPDQSLKENLGQNALANTALETLPYPFKLGKKLFTSLKPDEYAGKIINSLSSGRNLTDSGKSIAEDIKNSYSNIKDKFTRRYADIFSNNNVGSDFVYDRLHPLEGISKPGKLEKLEINPAEDLKDSSLREQYENVLKNPTFKNMHYFQSDLGKEKRFLEGNIKNLDDASRRRLNLYKKMQSATKEDIHSYLEKANPDVKKDYLQTTKDYEREMVPYFYKKNLSKIGEGDIKNPGVNKIINIFKDPEEDINKVVEHMPPDFKNKIVHLGIGKENYNVDSEGLKNALNTFTKRGLSEYLTPELKENVNALNKIQNKEELRKGVQSLVGGGLGYLLGNLTHRPLIELGGAATGAHYSPKIMNAIQNTNLFNKTGKLLSKSYRPLGQIGIENSLNNR